MVQIYALRNNDNTIEDEGMMFNMHILYIYIFLYTRSSPLSFYPLSLWNFLPFRSLTLHRFIVSNYYYYNYYLTNVRIVRERLSEVFKWWGVFLCWIFYVPLRCCYLLRSALCIIFEHCVRTCIPYSPTYSNIEKYCYRTYLFFVTECVQWECAIECATYKPNILIYTQK